MNWKRALMIGSVAAGGVLLLRGPRWAGVALTGVGAAVLASEYPDEVRDLWQRAPELLERGATVVAAVGEISDRVRREGPRLARRAWEEAVG